MAVDGYVPPEPRYRTTIVLMVFALLAALTGPGHAQDQVLLTKLHPRLVALLSAGERPAPAGRGLLRIDDTGRVHVNVRVTEVTDTLLDALGSAGGSIDRALDTVIQAWVPVGSLPAVADLPEVRYVDLPAYGQPQVGSVTTQGDQVIGAAAVRQQFGVSGSGVRVGVISNGIGGLLDSISSGNLPATTFSCRSGSTVTVRPSGCLAAETLVQTSGGITGKSFRSGGNLADGAEGTAMLEIVHDLAPSAELWFAGAETALDLQAAAGYLAANVDVLVSDIVFHGFFPNGQNTVAQATATIMSSPNNRARAYIQSAGNQADGHYASVYRAAESGDSFGHYHLFAATSDTTGPSTPSVYNRITVPPRASVTVFLSWDDPAGASTNDYDLLLVDCASLLFLDSSTAFQGPSSPIEPRESVSFFNPSTLFSRDVCYAIQNVFNSAAPRTLNVTLTSLGHQFNTVSRSLLAPADAPGDLITVGAVRADSPTQVESFSSRGPTFDGRAKPDVVAPDGVAVSGAGGFQTPFFGTSAAAPHVAGLAALLLELNPTLTRSQVKTVLQQSATSLGDANTFGAGRLNASAAATQALALRPVLAVSPGATLDFGTSPVGQSVSKTFTVTNTGVNPLAGSVVAASPFEVTSGASFTLASGDNRIVTVRFRPTAPGTYAGSVNFTSNGGSASRAASGRAGPTAFSDATLTAQSTPIRAAHINELRSAINSIRIGHGLAAFDWTDPVLVPGVTPVRRAHLTELRQALTETGGAPPSTDSLIAPGVTVIKEIHIRELRDAAHALE